MEWIYILLLVMLPLCLSKCVQRNYDALQIEGKYKVTPLLIIAFVMSVLIKGLAYNTGADYLGYYDYFATGLTVHKTDFEFGFQFYKHVFSILQLPTQVFFIIAAILYYGSVIILAKKFINAAPFILFFWSLLFFILSCNIYRQYYAFAFIFLAVYYYCSEARKKSLLCMFLAFSVHYSSFLVVPSFLFCQYLERVKVKYWMIAALIILTSIVGDLFSHIIEGAYYVFAPVLQYFLGGDVYDLGAMLDDKYNTSYAMVLSFFFLVWSYLGFQIKDKYAYFTPLYYMSVIYFVLYPLFQQEIMSRIIMYFQIFVPIVYGIVFKHYYNLRGKRLIPFLLLLGSTLIYFALFMNSLVSLLKIYPYQINI